MKCEILDYKTELSWNLDSFLSDPNFKSQIDPTWPLVVATLSSVVETAPENLMTAFLAGKPRGKPSTLRNGTIHSTVSKVGEQLGMSRQIFNIQAACASSLYAFYIASMMSLDSQTPVVLFAGDVVTDYAIWHFRSFGALDQDTGKPFDKSSIGFRMGTGMALYIIKHPSVKSKLDPKAVIQDFAFFTKPELIANPGSVDEMIANLSHLNYKNIDLWNAHATGTPVGDQAEYEYFAKTIKQDIPIVSFKGHVGHCMAASSSIEIAMALDGKKNNVLLPNVIVGDKLANDDRIITEPTSFTYKKMLKASLGFGGTTIIAEIDLL
jgi:3-oxoacyl-[acyl-carrier-protein] synthase II